MADHANPNRAPRSPSRRSTSRISRWKIRERRSPFSPPMAPNVEVGLRTRGEQVEENVFECVLTITVTAKAGDKTLFLVEAAQAGLFRIQGIPMADMQPIMGIHCPERAVSIRTRDHRRCDHARGLSAGASRSDQLRDAVPAAARQSAAAAGGVAGPELRRRDAPHPRASPRCSRSGGGRVRRRNSMRRPMSR